MSVFHRKGARKLAHRSNLYPVYIAAAVLVVLIAALVTTVVLGRRFSAQLDLNRKQLSEHIQSELNLAVRAFDEVDLPTANLEESIIPAMRLHLYAADAMNDVLSSVYGADASIFTSDLYRNIVMALDAIEASRKAGQTTNNDLAALKEFMAQLESDMNTKFQSVNLLMPQT